MATSIQEIAEFLTNRELKHEVDEQRGVIVTGFQTKHYIDGEGDQYLGMIISPEEDGKFLKVFTPRCYVVGEETNRAALMQTLLMVSWRTKMVQFEFDDSDGEIRAIIEFPLEDAFLTEQQLYRTVNTLVAIVDQFHPVIIKALEEGVIDFGDTENPLEALQEQFSRFEAMLEELGIDVDEILKEDAEDVDKDDDDDDDDFYI